MPLAEVIVRRGDRGTAPLAANDVSARFEAVIAERGPVGVPIEARSWSQVQAVLGNHTSYSTLRATESYFAEGGGRAVLTRVVGPGRRTASLDLRDSTGAPVITVTAAGPGAWYHGLRVSVSGADATARTITLSLGNETLVSGTVSDEDAAADLIATSSYVTAAIGGGRWPVVAASAVLAGGEDDYSGISVTEVTAALDLFEENLGAGSVTASGWTTVEVHRALAEHAAERNRFARGDLPELARADALIGHAADIRALPQAGHIQLLAGWPRISIAGVMVSVPPSGVHTGREARTDTANGPGPGQPCAWTFGQYATPLGISQTWSRSEREQMTDAGITLLVQDEGATFAEDAITAADPIRFPQYSEVAGMRVTMAIHSQCKAVLRKRVRQTLDGRGHVAASTTKDLVSICADWYQRDALYGATPAEAYSAVVTGETLSDGRARLVGNLELRPSRSAQTVELTITQVATGDTI